MRQAHGQGSKSARQFMTRRRASHAPEINFQALMQFRDNFLRSDLLRLSQRLAYLENLRREEKLSTPFIALEAITAILGGLIEGYSIDDLKEAFPSEWGHQEIKLPAVLVDAICRSWVEYKETADQQSMAQAFKIEGKNLNTRKSLTTLQTLDRHLMLARHVEVEYLVGKFQDPPLSLEEAIGLISESHGASYETVKKAHKKHKAKIRDQLKLAGVLRG